MTLDSSGKGFVATAIPITPYDDDGTWDPYGAATITVTDNSGHTETANVVAPVSTEMDCLTAMVTQLLPTRPISYNSMIKIRAPHYIATI